MRRIALLLPVLALTFGFPGSVLAEESIPAGKEDLVIDSMSKAREAAGKKVLKGPVPFAHQAHVDSEVACAECHHKQAEGETPKPCGACHSDKKGDAPKLSDAFHGEGTGSLPPLNSCIGCHKRKVSVSRSTDAPVERKPCEACHSILGK